MRLYFIAEKKRYNTRSHSRKQRMLADIPDNNQAKPCYVKIARLDPIKIQRYLKPQIERKEDGEIDDRKQYSLRTRRQVNTVKENKSLKTNTKPKMNINRAWSDLKKKSTKQFNKDDIVCARVRGFRPWPAKIESIVLTSVKVKFFGCNTHGIVSVSECVPIVECTELILELLLNPVKNFEKGVLELEIESGVPTKNSLVLMAKKIKK